MSRFTTISAEDTLFFDQAQNILAECADLISACSEGHLNVRPPDMYSISKHSMQHVRRSVFATSYGNIIDFWTSPEGRDYWEENMALLKRSAPTDSKVRITRVFILKDASQPLDGRVRDIIREQLDEGVDARIVYSDELEAECRRDMAIFDEAYVEYQDVNTHEAKISRIRVDMKAAERIKRHILQKARRASDHI